MPRNGEGGGDVIKPWVSRWESHKFSTGEVTTLHLEGRKVELGERIDQLNAKLDGYGMPRINKDDGSFPVGGEDGYPEDVDAGFVGQAIAVAEEYRRVLELLNRSQE